MRAELPAPLPPPDPNSPTSVKLRAAEAARAACIVTTRDQAMRNSVANRSRDIVCGVLGSLALTRWRADGDGAEVDLGPGWLRRPDPDHTLQYFVSWITDDLFWYAFAYARVTSRNFEGQANALQWLPFMQVLPEPMGGIVLGWPAPNGRLVALPGQAVTWYPPGLDPVHVPAGDLVIFEGGLSGVLGAGAAVLSTAARLDASADRFASAEIPAGWLEQTDGEDLTGAELAERAQLFAAARLDNSIAATNRYMKYNESQMDPGRLQLVEGRSYQDAATARICNVPNFIVGVGVPNDSMTYKTALTARLDLLDFGLNPYVTTWEQTLSSEAVTPRGTRVAFDVEPFLRTSTLSGIVGPTAAPAADTRTA